MQEIIAQAFGLVGMCFNVFSFQCRKKTHLIAVLGCGSLMFALNYILIGAFSSAGFNIINIVRSVCIPIKKVHNNFVFAVLCALNITIAAITYVSFWTIILLISQLVITFCLWYKDGYVIRMGQLFCLSPIWLINNMFVSFTLGGIICEAFTIVSVIVSFIRFRKNSELLRNSKE